VNIPTVKFPQLVPYVPTPLLQWQTADPPESPDRKAEYQQHDQYDEYRQFATRGSGDSNR
jgi:hypothetical protein